MQCCHNQMCCIPNKAHSFGETMAICRLAPPSSHMDVVLLRMLILGLRACFQGWPGAHFPRVLASWASFFFHRSLHFINWSLAAASTSASHPFFKAFRFLFVAFQHLHQSKTRQQIQALQENCKERLLKANRHGIFIMLEILYLRGYGVLRNGAFPFSWSIARSV